MTPQTRSWDAPSRASMLVASIVINGVLLAIACGLLKLAYYVIERWMR